jgi:hypothetical protein
MRIHPEILTPKETRVLTLGNLTTKGYGVLRRGTQRILIIWNRIIWN